jgi:hypothetical protein
MLEELKVADQKGRILLGSRYAGKRFALREEDDGTTVLTPVAIIPENEGVITSRRLAERFAALEKLNDNWDGNGSVAPAAAVIHNAREVMALLQASALARNLPWVEPHIGANERGQIVLEWWQGDRTLTLFVRSPNQVDYLRAWGVDISKEMEDGGVSQVSEFIALSHWLYQDAEGTE